MSILELYLEGWEIVSCRTSRGHGSAECEDGPVDEGGAISSLDLSPLPKTPLIYSHFYFFYMKKRIAKEYGKHKKKQIKKKRGIFICGGYKK